MGDAAAVSPVDPSWICVRLSFKSGPSHKARIYLRLQDAVGAAWFDAVEVQGVKLVNPGLEEVADDGGLVGWGQDNVGKTITADETVAFAGRRSVRIEHQRRGAPRMSRVWQDFAVEPDRTYQVTVYGRTRGVTGGSAYAEVYRMKPDGGHDSCQHCRPHLSADSGKGLGRRVCAVEAREGDVGVGQVLACAKQANLSLSADTLGKSRLEVRTVSGDLLAAADQDGEAWTRAGVNFSTGGEGRVQVRLLSRGGRALFDNVSISGPRVSPAPRKVSWRSSAGNFALDAKTRLVLPPDSPLLRNGARLLNSALKKSVGVELTVASGPEARAIRVEPLGATFSREEGSQGFRMNVERSGVTIAAESEEGAFYGLMALPTLVTQGKGGPALMGCRIEDEPDLPFRASYFGCSHLTDGVKARLEEMARLRYNAVLIESGGFFHLDDEKTRTQMEELFEFCRSINLDPIPELQSFGHAHHVLRAHPNLAEAKWVQGEPCTLKGEGFVEIKHTNIINTPSSHLAVTSADGQTAYEEGKDYRLEKGELKLRHSGEIRPWRIARVAGGRIPDGGTVLLSYDYVPGQTRPFLRDWGRSYCPSEPLVYEILRPTVERTIRHLRPRFLHIGHDEVGRMGTDSRCKKTGKTNAQLFADEAAWWEKTVRSIDPRIRVMMWADMINPYHLGLRHKEGPTAPAADLIPKSIIQCVWFYGPSQPLGKGKQSLDFFAARGFATTGSPWDDAQCCRNWAAVCGKARRRGHDCMGVIYTSWSGRWGGLAALAEAAWRLPRHSTR